MVILSNYNYHLLVKGPKTEMQWRTTRRASCGFFFFFFFFFFAAGDLAWLWGWKSHGGEREKESAIQILLGLEISIECIK